MEPWLRRYNSVPFTRKLPTWALRCDGGFGQAPVPGGGGCWLGDGNSPKRVRLKKKQHQGGFFDLFLMKEGVLDKCPSGGSGHMLGAKGTFG